MACENLIIWVKRIFYTSKWMENEFEGNNKNFAVDEEIGFSPTA